MLPFGIRQHDLLGYFDIGKRIRDALCAIHKPNKTGRASLYHDAGTSFTVFGFSSVFCGALTNCPRPVGPKRRTILLSSVHRMFLQFSLGLLTGSLANCVLFLGVVVGGGVFSLID